MPGTNTEFLQMLIFPDITGIYQKELRESYLENFQKIDQAWKQLDSAIQQAQEDLQEFDLPIATTTTLGKVKPDGITITIDGSGTIKAEVYTKDQVYTKEEVDHMIQVLTDNFVTDADVQDLGDSVDTLLGEDNAYTELGGSVVEINDLVDEILS